MSDSKNAFELASEITTAAMGNTTNWINKPDAVTKFYRAIYKEILTCGGTSIEDLR